MSSFIFMKLKLHAIYDENVNYWHVHVCCRFPTIGEFTHKMGVTHWLHYYAVSVASNYIRYQCTSKPIL